MAPENEKGEEILDRTPVAMPLNYEVPEPLEKMVARMVRAASAHSASLGNETFEEADDFGPDEEDDLEGSPYQFKTMEEEYLDEKSRTSTQGRTAGTSVNEKDAGSDSGKVSESGKTSGIEPAGDRTVGSQNSGRFQRRSTDRTERRQTANSQTDSRQGNS